MIDEQYLDEKEIKEYLFQILIIFADFCDRHNLKYYLCGGTLLGAIRHKDFIPWDDDLDVMMPRPDFQALHKLLKEEKLKDGLVLISKENGNSIYPFGKIVNTNIVVKCRCNDVDKHLWLDIFPIDGLPNSEEKSNKLLNQAKYFKSMLSASTSKYFNGATKWRAILKMPKLFVSHIIGHNYWYKKLYHLFTKYDYEQANYVGGIAWSCGAGERMKKEDFLESAEVEFHGQNFHAPACWHTYLQGLYGDYMTLPPVKKRYGHMMTVSGIED